MTSWTLDGDISARVAAMELDAPQKEWFIWRRTNCHSSWERVPGPAFSGRGLAAAARDMAQADRLEWGRRGLTWYGSFAPGHRDSDPDECLTDEEAIARLGSSELARIGSLPDPAVEARRCALGSDRSHAHFYRRLAQRYDTSRRSQ